MKETAVNYVWISHVEDICIFTNQIDDVLYAAHSEIHQIQLPRILTTGYSMTYLFSISDDWLISLIKSLDLSSLCRLDTAICNMSGRLLWHHCLRITMARHVIEYGYCHESIEWMMFCIQRIQKSIKFSYHEFLLQDIR